MSILSFTQPLCEISELPLNQPKKFGFKDDSVVLLRTKNGIHLFPSRCPHRGTSLEHAKVTETDTLQCPYHGWSLKSDGTVRDSARNARADCKFYPSQAVEKHGLIWLQKEQAIPTPDLNKFTPVGSFSTTLSAPFHVVLDNFNEGLHTLFIHRFTGPRAKDLAQVKFEWKENAETIESFYDGPQRRNFLFPEKNLRWKISWKTFFQPCFMEYDSSWYHSGSDKLARPTLKHFYYIAPLDDHRTRLHAIVFADLNQVPTIFKPIYKMLALYFTRNQVREDEKFYPAIRDLPISTAAIHPETYDLPVLRIRARANSEYLLNSK
jgi:phenylpropionate dioxygenase-like ring-hydroxylating dioxygenase large terminal subunit